MDKNQAFNLLVQVVEQYKGTAEEHRLLAKARIVLAEAIKDKEVKKVNKTDK